MSRRVQLSSASRMQATPLFQLRDSDGNVTNEYAWGTWEPPDIPSDATDDVHVVTDNDLGRVDLLADKFYGNVSLYWIILHVNDIMDQFTTDPTMLGLVPGTVLRIPKKARVLAILQSGKTLTSGSTLE